MKHALTAASAALAAGLTLATTGTIVAEEARSVACFTELRLGKDTPRPLSGYIWYPGRPGVAPLRLGANAVRKDFDVYPNAQPADGEAPLVVLSHGLMGHAMNQGWLAIRLAEAGYVVASVHHPGTSWVNRDPAERRALWERPNDLSRTISAMLDHPVFGPRIDPKRIAVIGHSLGDYDVAALMGARLDMDRHMAYCAGNATEADCRFATDTDMHDKGADRAALQADLSDSRIAAGITLDLGLVQAMDPQSLADMTRLVLVIGAGRTPGVLRVAYESRAFAAALPDTSRTYVERADLGHYDALGLFNLGAQAILEAEEPGIPKVCEAGGDERAFITPGWPRQSCRSCTTTFQRTEPRASG